MNSVFGKFAICGLLISLPSLTTAGELVGDISSRENQSPSMTAINTYPQALSFAAGGDIIVESKLDLNELTNIQVPQNFNLADKIAWSVGLWLNPASYRALVPIYGYRWQDVCQNAGTGAGILDSIETGTSLIQGVLSLTVYEGERHAGANWHASVESACSVEQINDLNQYPENVVRMLSDPLVGFVNDEADRFLLTAIPLRNVDEIVEYLGECNVNLITTDIRSVCQARLASHTY